MLSKVAHSTTLLLSRLPRPLLLSLLAWLFSSDVPCNEVAQRHELLPPAVRKVVLPNLCMQADVQYGRGRMRAGQRCPSSSNMGSD